jgi:hypothetical protein
MILIFILIVILSVALFYISKLQQILGVLITIQDTVDSIKMPSEKVINDSIKKLSDIGLNELSINFEKIKNLINL